MYNKLLIAAAGAGKTTYLIQRALEISDERVLILTYTIENEQEIRSKFIELNTSGKCIPSNVTVQTWFSFLIQHGVKPYQGKVYPEAIKGMVFVQSQSGVKYIDKRTKRPVIYAESEGIDKYYLSKQSKIYSDKLAKFVTLCNEKSNGAVMNRLTDIYKHIFIDEVQDLAGYDLDILLLLFASNAKIILVGDPRQTTYQTHHARKFPKYKDGKIREFVEQECKKKHPCEVDLQTLNDSWRNNEAICCFSSQLYPDFPVPNSKQEKTTGHDGVFLIKESDINRYLLDYRPIQLRWGRNSKGVNPNFPVMNFGQSKGKGFDRVVIFPTDKFVKWLKNRSTTLEDSSKAKFYVALTRAKYSVGIVIGNADFDSISGITKYTPIQTTLF